MRIANRGPYDAALSRLAVAPDSCVLELGFGPGEGIARLVDLAPAGRIAGIDASPEMLRVATKRNASAVGRGHAGLLRSDFGSLPFPARSFDRVLAVNVVYFWERPEVIVREIVRVLKPGGRLVVFATDRQSMEKWSFAGPDTHLHFDAGSLAALFERGVADFSSVRVDEIRLRGGVRGLCAVADRPIAALRALAS